MSPEVEKLFFATADLDADGRRRYLDRHCPSPRIRADVERLLKCDPGSERFLKSPLVSLAGNLRRERDATAAKRAGPYVLVRELGYGGMGTVYEAERLDGEVRLRAAVKFVPAELQTDAVLAKFRQERQILANLNHANIARLLDAGTANDGSPYFVMELVDGVPIDEWCRARRLSPRQIVELFLPVCSAVHHAHSHLVVHRDLKPQNILVNAGGQPKLLDFGIAKLIDDANRLLQTKVRAWTPDYASPEQIEGRTITAATDTFGLGCVLHKLLTGKPPARRGRQTAGPHCAGDATADPALKGDLRAIVAKALATRPSQRYATARDLSADLRRYLTLRPVEARAGEWGYRAVCFVRRNRWLVAALVALALALAGVAAMAWKSDRPGPPAQRAVTADCLRSPDSSLLPRRSSLGGRCRS